MSEQPPEPRKRRISITRLQRNTETATELIALCQTVTEDGHLEEQEIQALREWLDANKTSDLPAIGFLTETAERILADGGNNILDGRNFVAYSSFHEIEHRQSEPT